MQKKSGFTLVEVIIVIAIVGIISAVSWSILNGAKKAAAVNDACNQVAAMINKTRNYALSGKQDNNGNVPDSFRIKTGGPIVIYSVISNTETQMESFSLAGGISCGSYILTYNIPDGLGGVSQDVICTDVDIDALRTVKVSPYTAFCQ